MTCNPKLPRHGAMSSRLGLFTNTTFFGKCCICPTFLLSLYTKLVSSYSFPEEPNHSCWRVGDAVIGNGVLERKLPPPLLEILQSTALGLPARTDSAVLGASTNPGQAYE